MCGISGIINKSNTPVPRDEIKRITDLVIHRGPDSEGYYFGKNFAFGHRRLNVIDLSSTGNQPMTYKGKYTITYNGEIYNYLEIRNDLRKAGYDFASESDTEVILAAYDYYGQKCVELFNGMWAFALYDIQKDIIFCSRDRFGVKPFYYTETPEKFVFGSEIKQLLGYHRQQKVNQPILLDYLVSGYDDHTNESFFQDIHKLEQSHILIYDLKKHTLFKSRYYEIRLDETISKLDEQDSIEMFREVLFDSIRLRLRSDVKVGTCLSGGLDSSSIASIASGLYQSVSAGKFTSITAKSSEAETDESSYAELVSNHSGIDWKVVCPDSADFINSLNKIVNIQEEPFGSPSVFMQFKVFEKAKEAGCIVMLDGQGGDETLLGYERYYPAIMIAEGLLKMIMGFRAKSVNSGLSGKELLQYLLYFTIPSIRIQHLKKRFSIVNNEYFALINSEFIRESAKSYRNIFELQKLEITQLQLPHLLKYEDRNSMANSVESRLPFIDYRLLEVALSLNSEFKIKDGWTKYILRKSVLEYLPHEIVWRKNKIGFNAPEKTWMTSIASLIKNQVSRSEILEKVINKKNLFAKYDTLDHRTLWRLFNIAKWEEVFNVSID
jgi:asparagine synthase (glutamine-hydrolysing)